MWNELSMADRAKYIALGIQNGVTSLDTIRSAYNSYAEGGYKDWTEKLKESREGIEEDIDSNNPTYDYQGFYNESPERAWRMLEGDNRAHFIDKYKKPNHPTFSDESIYSNNSTKGGKWKETLDGKYYYVPSRYTGTPERLQETRDYLTNSGEGYIDYNGDLRFPFAQEDRGDDNIWLPGVEVTSQYANGGRVNKYDGTSQSTQHMERINYYDPITGQNYGSIRPEGKVQVTSLSQLTPKAQDEYMSNRATTLPELIVYPRTGLGAKSTTIGSWYDTINNLTESNRQHTVRVAESDARVRETSAFEKPLNFLSPGQWFGAYVDYKQGESPFWSGIYNGNSGWVTDEFAKENPRATVLLNMLGDTALTYAVGKGYSAAKNSNTVRGYRLSRAMNKALEDSNLFSDSPITTKDFSFISPEDDLMIHADRGNGVGAFTGRGAFTEDGMLKPGKAKIQNQKDYTWFNETSPYTLSTRRGPMTRVFIGKRENIPGISRVRDMAEPVGQWPGKGVKSKSFVKKSEYVTSEDVPTSDLLQYNLDPYEGVYVQDGYPILENRGTFDYGTVKPGEYRQGYKTQGKKVSTRKTGSQHFQEDVSNPENPKLSGPVDDVKITKVSKTEPKVKEIDNWEGPNKGSYVEDFIPQEHITIKLGEIGKYIGEYQNPLLDPSRVTRSIRRPQLFDNWHRFMSTQPEQYMFTDYFHYPMTLWHKFGGVLRKR